MDRASDARALFDEAVLIHRKSGQLGMLPGPSELRAWLLRDQTVPALPVACMHAYRDEMLIEHNLTACAAGGCSGGLTRSHRG